MRPQRSGSKSAGSARTRLRSPSHHNVTLTIKAGAVTAVEITTPAEDETSLAQITEQAAA